MTTPPDPPRTGWDETLAVPTGPPGQSQYPGPPGGYPPGGYPGRQPYVDQPTANLAYNPYGQQQYPDYSQFPAAFPADIAPPSRPGYLYLAFLLLLLSALPFLLGAAGALVGAASIETMAPPELLEQIRATGFDLVAFVTGIGVFIGVVAVLYLIFAVVAVVGRNWARVLVTIMTGIFVLVGGFVALAGLAAGGAAAAADPGLAGGELLIGILVIAAPGILALIGTILLFLPAANRFYRRR